MRPTELTVGLVTCPALLVQVTKCRTGECGNLVATPVSRRSFHCAVCPPSITNSLPVMNDDSSEARNDIYFRNPLGFFAYVQVDIGSFAARFVYLGLNLLPFLVEYVSKHDFAALLGEKPGFGGSLASCAATD